MGKSPLQDFTPSSDIDWTASIPEIDQQLYKKYNLTKDEIDFIESMVRTMDANTKEESTNDGGDDE